MSKYIADSNMTDDWIERACAANPVAPMVNPQDGTISDTVWTLGPMRVNYAQTLFTPQEQKINGVPTGKMNYNAQFIAPLCTDFTPIYQAWQKMQYAKFPNHYDPQANQFVGLHNPFREQREMKVKGKKGFLMQGYFFSPGSDYPPQIVDTQYMEIKNPALLKSGFWVIPQVNLHAIGLNPKPGATGTRKGINFGLIGMMVIAPDQELGSAGAGDPRQNFGRVNLIDGMALNAAAMAAPVGHMPQPNFQQNPGAGMPLPAAPQPGTAPMQPMGMPQPGMAPMQPMGMPQPGMAPMQPMGMPQFGNVQPPAAPGFAGPGLAPPPMPPRR